jgi:hypothetical protein
MPFGATPSRWCVCQFHHFRRVFQTIRVRQVDYNKALRVVQAAIPLVQSCADEDQVRDWVAFAALPGYAPRLAFVTPPSVHRDGVLMNSCRSFWFALSLVLLIAISGCGGGNEGYNPNDVSVSVSPPSTTVSAGGQTTIVATVNGLCNTCAPQVLWSIKEMEDVAGGGAQCNWFDGAPPTGPCPFGTIDGAQTTTVIFHAPSSAATVHVVAEWTTLFDPIVTRTATSTITVQ